MEILNLLERNILALDIQLWTIIHVYKTTCIMHPTLFPGFSWSCLQSQNTRRYNARDGRIFRPSYSTSTRTMGSRNTYWPSNKCSLAGKYNHPILCKHLPFRACIRLPPVKFLHLLIYNLVGLVSQEILFSWLSLPGDTIFQ